MSDSPDERSHASTAGEDHQYDLPSEGRLGTTRSTTVAITEALASQRDGQSPLVTDLPPLYEYIDTDALDALIRNTPAATQLQVEFQLGDMTVYVASDGTVLVS